MHPRLSARQEQCLRLTAFRTDKEIAAHLGISEATVKKHVHEACQRLGVNRRKAALALLDPIVPDGPETAAPASAAGYPKHPMALRDPDRHVSRHVQQDPDEDDGRGRVAPDLRQSNDGARDENHDGAADGRRVSAGSPDRDDERGRLGYRVPPGNPLLRVVLIVVVTIVLAALVVTVVVMLGDMHEAVGKIDAAAKARSA